MKSRFSSLDVCAIATELKGSIVGSKLLNVYETPGQKEYVFKFNQKVSQSNSLDGESEKFFMLIENGIRCHRTMYRCKEFSDTHHSGPLLVKLRSLLKGRRVLSIWQISNDRVMVIEFDGIDHFHPKLILEFFSEGNIIVVDNDWKILAIHRIPRGTKSVHVGDVYSIDSLSSTSSLSESHILQHIINSKASNPKQKLSKTISSIPAIGSALLEHIVLSLEHSYSHLMNISLQDLLLENPEISCLIAQIQLIFNDMNHIISATQNSRGYLIQSKRLTLEDRNNISLQIQQMMQPETFTSSLWTEYHPVLLKQHQDTHIPLPTFSMAVDIFYMMISWNKQICDLREREEEFSRRMNIISHEIDSNIESMMNDMKQAQTKAQTLENNIQQVQQCLWVVDAALENGINWTELEALVKDEQRKGNPIAIMIQALDLEHGKITISLDKVQNISIIISKTPFGNVQYYYEEKKRLEHKYNKTIQQREQILRDLRLKLEQKRDKKGKLGNVPGIVPLRKSMWFEKFHWFISSENLLIICGRDAHQNEQIVKRYMRSKDIYVHSDIPGAPSVVVFVPDTDHLDVDTGLIPHKTILEAGSMAVCNSSKAWTSHIVTSAFWVNADQVTRTTQSGEYLPSTGSFVIRGKKHYIPHSSLVYGFGILFKLGDEASIKRHKGERAIKEMALENNEDVYEVNMEKLERKLDKCINLEERVDKLESKEVARTKEPTKRGKNSKLKKIKTKYRHQDDEERNLRMNLLKKRENNVRKEKENKDTKVSTIRKSHVDRQEIQENIDPEDHETGFEQSRGEQQQLLDSFTGTPIVDDVLSFAIAICAPYSTLSGYKYKVKLVPGTLSKGKSVKSAISTFIKMKTSTDQEIRLIKQISEDEAQRCMLNQVKISFVGQK